MLVILDNSENRSGWDGEHMPPGTPLHALAHSELDETRALPSRIEFT